MMDTTVCSYLCASSLSKTSYTLWRLFPLSRLTSPDRVMPTWLLLMEDLYRPRGPKKNMRRRKFPFKSLHKSDGVSGKKHVKSITYLSSLFILALTVS